MNNTVAYFINNTATNGGALSLLGLSILELYPGSQVIFDSNHASQLGGAVYATSTHQTQFIFSHQCFISHYRNVHPENWTTLLIFKNNKARYGNDIFTDSVLPCARAVYDTVVDVESALRWTTFKYTENMTIATSPASITFTLPEEISPGEKIDIMSVSVDDLGQPISSAYQVFLHIFTGTAKTNPYISDDDHLLIYGSPGTEFGLTLQSQTTRHMSSSGNGTLGNCPLGLSLDKDYNTCVCSANTADEYLLGINECNMSAFRAILLNGYWIGCTHGSKVATGSCPKGYCKNNDHQLVPRTCSDFNIESMCIDHRGGQLCGECEEGYTVYYHSENFKCGQCSYGALGILIYIFAELVPLLLMFVVIMVMRLKMTSGLMQSLLLFAQMITLINRINSVESTAHIFIQIHTFILGFLQMDFFHLDALSFCVWKGAKTLDNLLLRYFTTLFAILLVIFCIFIEKHNLKIIHCKKLKIIAGKFRLFKHSVVHGISTFLILSYTQYTITSFQILSRRLPIYEKGGKVHHYAVCVQGDVVYLGLEHIPYAIPAILVLLILSIPPPLLLISYPLLWKIKAKLRCNSRTENDTTLWPIRKLLPLIDSFQGVFTENCRMFAGLLFLWRMILTAIFAFSSTITEFYLMTEIALLTFFAIHSIARPYKRRLYNMIDSVMFANLAIINALSWYNSTESEELVYITAIKLLLMYLPLVCLAALFVFWLLHKHGILTKILTTLKYEPGAAKNHTPNTVVGDVTPKQQQSICTDDDLFSRAAELNHIPPLTLTGSETETKLQTTETTLNTDTKI